MIICFSLFFFHDVLAVMVGWIYQIFLSEILGVPSTIDGNSLLRDSTFSFYDRKSRFVMPSEGYPLDQLVQADRYDGDCSESELPCSHIFPLVLERGIRRARSFDGEHNYLCPVEKTDNVDLTLLFL